MMNFMNRLSDLHLSASSMGMYIASAALLLLLIAAIRGARARSGNDGPQAPSAAAMKALQFAVAAVIAGGPAWYVGWTMMPPQTVTEVVETPVEKVVVKEVPDTSLVSQINDLRGQVATANAAREAVEARERQVKEFVAQTETARQQAENRVMEMARRLEAYIPPKLDEEAVKWLDKQIETKVTHQHDSSKAPKDRYGMEETKRYQHRDYPGFYVYYPGCVACDTLFQYRLQRDGIYDKRDMEREAHEAAKHMEMVRTSRDEINALALRLDKEHAPFAQHAKTQTNRPLPKCKACKSNKEIVSKIRNIEAIASLPAMDLGEPEDEDTGK